MHAAETYLTDFRLRTLKKAIPTWITGLQGTGNRELNQVVNDLHQLNHEVHNAAGDGENLRQQITNLYRQVQVLKGKHQEPYRTRLGEVEAELAKLRS